MAQQVINVGTAPNDGTGDPIRTAYIKTNTNFGELYNRVQTSPPASLTGSIGDTAGMYAYDQNYFYYCYANFDGSTQIWNQISNSGNVSVTNIASGNSSIGLSNINGNANISVRGVSNVAVFSATETDIAGNLIVTGNVDGANINGRNLYATGKISAVGTITGNFFVGNGAFLTGITTTYGNSNVATYLPTYTGGLPSLLGNVTTTANVQGTYILGNGAFLTGVATSSYGNSNVASYLTGYTGNIAASYINATGNIQGNYILGNGSQLTGLPANYGNSNVASYLPTYSGNLSPGNLTTTGIISTTGNVYGGNVLQNGVRAYKYSTGNTAPTNAVAGDNWWYTAGNVLYQYINDGVGSQWVDVFDPSFPPVTSSISANSIPQRDANGNLTANVFTGTSVSVTGNVIGQNFYSAGVASVQGNITGSYFIGNGSQLTGLPANYGNTNVASFLPTYTGNYSGGNISVTGNVSGYNFYSAGVASVQGNITGSYFLGNGSQLTGITASLAGNISGANVTYTAPFTNAVARTGTSKWSDMVNVMDFGATGNGTSDDRAAIQAAINTGKHVYVPTGTYRLSDGLVFGTTGQMVSGDGCNNTVFKVDNINYSFNMSAAGVFIFSTGEPGPQLANIGIKFVQPDTSVRANLKAYPPAIYAQNIPRFSIYNCRITNAMTGIDMRQNAGGATVDGLEMSGYDYAIRIDGALDTVRVIRMQFWPFDMTGNQTNIMFDSTTIGIESGRCDDLKVNNCLFINGGVQIKFISTAAGNTFGTITDTDFDTFGSIQMTSGEVSIINCYFTIGNAAYQAIIQTGGCLRVDSCGFQAAVALTNAMISISGASIMQMTNNTLRNSGPNGGYIVMTNGEAIINGNKFVTGANQTWTSPLIYINGSNPRATIVNNRSTDKGAGSGNFITITNDNWHMVANNLGIGWGYSYPGGYITMVVANNK